MSSDCSTNEKADVRPFPQEALLVDAIAEMSADRVLCTSPGLAQFAAAAAGALPQAAVECLYLDAYRAQRAKDHWPDQPPNLQIKCAADFLDAQADIVALPFSARGEGELAREFIQSAHARLRTGGKVYVSSDNPSDVWIGRQVGKLFGKLERRALTGGVVYVGTKTAHLNKTKDYTCEFAFRDRGRLIRVVSRPGVFSHRRIDPGARHLINEMELNPGDRVLDIGCGAGTVALAAACHGNDIAVHAVDSNARAVECTALGAKLNGLDNLTTELNADGSYRGAGRYDLALANPPYYAGFRIARHFLSAGREALRPGGRMLVVTKRPDWYAENIPQWYVNVSVAERKGYHVIRGVCPYE